MIPLRVHLPFHIDLSLTHRHLLWCAAIVAVALLSFYVQLLHESVARGDRLREGQRSAASTRTAKAAVPRAQTELVHPADAAQNADIRTR